MMTGPDRERRVGEIRIASGVDVAVAPQRAWDVVADFARNPEWQAGMRSCTWLTPPPVRPGSRYQQEARFLGRPITTMFEVVALDEPGDDGHGSITISSIASTFPLEITRTVAPTPRGCRIGADVAGHPDGWTAWLGPLLARMVQRSVDGDYRRLRSLLEDDPDPGTA
ncbi:SRPBCC family protein [Salsipaludibacter albus]|uniref:SRPBCC family protein n=1 Tax=Salsipaludibacter albus TaxID=2849650 RepID=UPI001EE3AFAA|nr:SRPBCC family protein [Salsipaludibacter albus]MBY5161040.1 SRPBCC family protein [Salsipaludibacter albus]